MGSLMNMCKLYLWENFQRPSKSVDRLQSFDVTAMNTRSDRMKRNEMSRGMGHHQGHPWDPRVIRVVDLSWHKPEDKLTAIELSKLYLPRASFTRKTHRLIIKENR
ncbi:hypothetical protein KQX54_016228 [Cotesia glomerata]|uniref:Uncharacterized protein n=1 Tax=Cotesia glomerata TaxID=32391 RepID=A0AAV7IE07_COTGL|nr:hypothetical protein KQX54_016228 [Cotesia glomerata]